jgi:hypothetical protein
MQQPNEYYVISTIPAYVAPLGKVALILALLATWWALV